ncbi:hypothetical protein [Pseudoprimorskyibacter insulae]|uniref:Uncharacterized protein n=1 Tax=Pseudoprimorskyibacter insulae TaxID=1695997 RepID=A0A2R8AQD3_9RHOB|nr:hypothetical protein [Pseudoprimorskyibacter insulae]SPF78296.1 hypothetical protein PRI8871_00892 [Pseudoprimorskyibacter insulae]
MKTLGLILALLAPATALPAMTGAEFQDYVTGKTIYFDQAGQPYGVEQYLPGNRVRWSLLDGNCKDGSWYEDGPHICFVYDDNPTPQCWTFEQRPDGIRAIFANDPDRLVLYEVSQSDKPMLCLGPEVGV